MEENENQQNGCFSEILNLLLAFVFLQVFLDLFYPEQKNITSDGKTRTSRCMIVLGIICCLIFLGAILKTCI